MGCEVFVELTLDELESTEEGLRLFNQYVSDLNPLRATASPPTGNDNKFDAKFTCSSADSCLIKKLGELNILDKAIINGKCVIEDTSKSESQPV
jgi:hypothetical protein